MTNIFVLSGSLWVDFDGIKLDDIEQLVSLLQRDGHSVRYDRNPDTNTTRWEYLCKSVEESDVLVVIMSRLLLSDENTVQILNYALNVNLPSRIVVIDWEESRTGTLSDDYHGNFPDDLKERVPYYHYSVNATLKDIAEFLEDYNKNKLVYQGIRRHAPRPTLHNQSIEVVKNAVQRGDYTKANSLLRAMMQNTQSASELVRPTIVKTLSTWQEIIDEYAQFANMARQRLKHADLHAVWKVYRDKFPRQQIPLFDPAGFDRTYQFPQAHRREQNSLINIEWVTVDGFQPSGFLQSRLRSTIPAFKISKYPITNRQFEFFLEDSGGYRILGWWNFEINATAWRLDRNRNEPTAFDGDDLPRTNVTWYEAVAFSNWMASEYGDETIALPSSKQWKHAAQGAERLAYPWGEEWKPDHCNCSVNSNSSGVRPVYYYNSVFESPYGVRDMVGNVWEWCSTSQEAKEDITKYAKQRVLHGGAWDSIDSKECSPKRKLMLPPQTASRIAGFRVISLDV